MKRPTALLASVALAIGGLVAAAGPIVVAPKGKLVITQHPKPGPMLGTPN